MRTTLTVQLGYLMLICSTVFLLSSDRIGLERRDEIKDDVRCRKDDLERVSYMRHQGLENRIEQVRVLLVAGRA